MKSASLLRKLMNMDIRNLDVLHDRTLEDRADILCRIQDGEVVRFDVEHCHKDGHIFPLAVTSSMIDLSGQQFYLAFHQDITERKRVEQELLLTRMSVESASDALYWMTPDGRIVNVNEAACRLLGYNRSELLQLSVPDVDANYNAEIWQ